MTLNGPDLHAHARRRRSLLEHFGESRSVLFVPGAPEAVYSNDVHYRYRPASNIRYLSGFEEPAKLLLSRCGRDTDGFTLFVQPRDPAAETWTGRRAGVEGARESYGADHAHDLDECYRVLEDRLRHADTFYFEFSRDPHVNERVMDVVRAVNRTRPRSGGDPLVVTEAASLLDELRLVKQSEEIAILGEACAISAAAHCGYMESVRPGMFEYQVEALIEQVFRDAGCAGPAYPTIAAGGDGATILHYTSNDKCLAAGTLLLVDAGGEYGGYCADITRTIPVDTAFSTAQASLYDLVLAAQLAAIDKVGPGNTYDDVHRAALEVLVQGMIDLKLLGGTAAEAIESESYKAYYMHGTSHWLGMDVHDVGSYRSDAGSRVLAPGMVLTVEPGIYVKADSDAPEHLRGTGIRIEDDVLVTADGHDVLTAAAPKAREEIEAIRRKALR